jgi:hypothetical protein
MEENKLYDLHDEPLHLNRFVCEITLDGVQIDSRVVRGFWEERNTDTLYINIASYENTDYEWLIDKAYNEKIGGVSVNCGSNIKPTISHIKSKIDQTIANLTYPELYKPDREGNLYVLNLSPDKVFVRRSKGATDYEIVPIKN